MGSTEKTIPEIKNKCSDLKWRPRKNIATQFGICLQNMSDGHI